MVVSSPQYGESIPFFLQLFRLRALWLRHFIGYSFGASRKNASTIFYSTTKNKASTVSYRIAKDKSGRPCQRAWLFHLHSMMRTYRFFSVVPFTGFMVKAFSDHSFRIKKGCVIETG